MRITASCRATDPVGIGFITWRLANQRALLEQALERARARSCCRSAIGRRSRRRSNLRGCGADLRGADRGHGAQALELGSASRRAGSGGGRSRRARGTLALVPAVVDLAAGRALGRGAGGIADGRGLAAAPTLARPACCWHAVSMPVRNAMGLRKRNVASAPRPAAIVFRGIIFDPVAQQRLAGRRSPAYAWSTINAGAGIGRESSLWGMFHLVAAEYAVARARQLPMPLSSPAKRSAIDDIRWWPNR